MKRTILIPILLSTFLLVGCETETELDRCIEANTDIDIDEAEFLSKVLAHRIEALNRAEVLRKSELSMDESMDEILLFQNNFDSSLTNTELKAYKCGKEKYSDRYEELFRKKIAKSVSEAIEILAPEEEEIFNACLPRVQAKAICHSQGIY